MPSYLPPGPCTPWTRAHPGPALLFSLPCTTSCLCWASAHTFPFTGNAFPSSNTWPPSTPKSPPSWNLSQQLPLRTYQHSLQPDVLKALLYAIWTRLHLFAKRVRVCVCTHTCMRVFYVPDLTVNPSGEHPWHYKPFSSHLGYHSSLLAGLPTSSPGPLENQPSTQQPEWPCWKHKWSCISPAKSLLVTCRFS